MGWISEGIYKQRHVDAGVASCPLQALEEGKEVAGGPFWTDKGFGCQRSLTGNLNPGLVHLMRGVRKDRPIFAHVARDMTGGQLGWNW